MIPLRFPFRCKLQLLILRFVLWLIALPVTVVAQTPASNLQTILQLFDRVAVRVGEDISHLAHPGVWIQPAANAKPEERFFASRLTSIFKDSLRLAVFVPLFGTPESGAEPVDSLQKTALTYQLSRCEIVYRKLPQRRFRRSARWQRAATIFVEVVAQNAASRQIEFQKFFTESAADTLSEKLLPRLEEASLPFTVGRKEEPPAGFRWLEPVLITSATGVVVYLFYALRSR